MSPLRLLSKSLVLVFVLSFTVSSSRAQITGVNSTTLTPVPGSGHDYIHMLNETVNPYNGSISLRIQLPIPKGRALTLPFGLAYDSDGVHFTLDSGVGGYWSSNVGSISKGGWSYTFPQVTYTGATKNFPNAGPPYSCDYDTNYVFYDPSGGRHNLVLNTGSSGDSRCSTLSARLNSGDAFYLANLSQDYSTVMISGLDGTTYKFAGFQGIPGLNAAYSFPAFIEDRNGNKLTVTNSGGGVFSETDTLGRIALSSSGFGSSGNTLSVPGVSQPYTLTWGTASSNFTLGITSPVTGQTCANGTNGFPATHTETQSVTTAIISTNGKQYQFSYDSTYGFLNQITYPTGGWVKYTWGINPQSEFTQFVNSNGTVASCIVDWFAVLHRYVSFDGANIALQQDFSYSTNWGGGIQWNTKQTTVVTKDCARNNFVCSSAPSFTTVYTYAPSIVFSDDPLNQGAGNQVPVEQTITYKDGSGNTLRTVSKNWYNTDLLQTEQVTLDTNLASKTAYTYVSPGAGVYQALITETDEYDYGQGAGPLLRKTVTNYASFPATPIYSFAPSILDRPSSVITYDGSGTRVAETDYAYDQSSVASASATQHDETNYSTSNNNRGNATTVTHKCLQSCGDAVTTYTYDETGQTLTMVDPCGNATCSDMNVPGETHTTTYSYADSYTTLSNGQNVSYTPSANTNAYLTRITHPTTVTADFNGTHAVQHVENFTYDFNNGQLTVSKDQNNQATAYLYNDSLARPTLINYPDGGQTTLSYNDSAPSPSVTTSKKIDTSGRLLTTVNVMDGLGHPVQAQLTTDPDGTDYTDTTYDGLGRVWKQSNPHRSASLPTDGTTTYFYDALGRSCLVVPPDGTLPSGGACPASQPANTVFTAYSGNVTTVTDQAGKKRQSATDGLGRINQVTEDPGGLGYVTTYAYDALDNLLAVTQNGSRQRLFGYDSLSRLTAANNPESGTIYYSYDANGNLFQKGAPAPNQTGTTTLFTTHGYDALNRSIWKVYSDSEASVQFQYDESSVLNGVSVSNPIGRLTAINTYGNSTYLTASAYFGYDQMGRVLSYFQCVLNCATSGWEMFYTYDFLGNTTSYTNGLGTTFTQNFDNAGRLYQITSSLSDSAHPSPLATVDSSVGFWPNGALRKIALGNGLYETAAYNSRLQPCRMNVNSTASYTLTHCNDALPGGNVQDFNYGLNFGSSDNGNVASWSATGNQNFNRSYTHDPLNRLATLSATSDPTGCNGLSWTYDAWGNRTDQTVTAGSCNTFHATVNTANQLLDPVNNIYQYDAAGNMTHDASHTYFYDAENRLAQVDGTFGTCSTATACYLYDADGKRVQKVTGATQTIYLYDLSGKVINELDGNNVALANYIYFNGSLLAEYKNATTYFVHKDHLGSTRLVTAITNPTSPVDNLDYGPFGEQVAGGSGTSRKFTGKERDAESGLDHFQFRKSSSALGRFMSPDPAGMMAVDIGTPQTLNRYSYVLNNPLAFTDPFGLDCAYLNSSGTGLDKKGVDQNSSSAECGKTGGYWVDGTITQVNIDSNATTISLTGTTNGTNQTSAFYQQDAVVTVGEYNNTSINPYNHIALGLAGQRQFGQNPRSDARFLWALSMHGPTASVPGAIKPQVGGRLLGTVRIRATGMQAQMLQNAMNQSAQNPPPYTIFGQTGCDCGTWAQMMLGDAGINAGPPAPLPDVLMQQLNQLYPQQQPPPQ